MNKIIKISLATLFLLLTTVTVNAQLLPVSLGLKGGVNFSRANGDITKNKSGFNAGLTLDLNLPAGLAIMSGLEITTKGTKFKESDVSVNAMYLQLPIHLGYRFGVPGARFHFNLGPYFAQGIGGKTKGVDTEGDKFKADTFGSATGQLRKLDWGLGVGVGVTFLGKIQVRMGYDHGMKNLAREGGKFKNRNAYVSAGLMFF